MWKDNRGLSIMEYILGGALVLAILGLSAYGIARATQSQGAAVKNSVDAMPPQPTWP